MGPWYCRILRAYWGRFQMLDCAGDYYGEAYQGFQEVTQGDPLSHTIFNMVVYAAVLHLLLLVAGSAGV